MADYIELEYIGSTRTQYIDTGISFSRSNKYYIEACIAFEGLSSSTQEWNGWNGGYAIVVENNRWYDGNSYFGSVSSGVFYEITSLYNSDSSTLNINNGLYTNTRNANNLSTYAKLNYTIFASVSKTTIMNKAQEKVKYFKIYVNDILVRDFIPVKRKSDNEICLYDKVTEQYFTNQGTGESDYLSASSNGSEYENPVYFDNAYRRTWLNNNFISALPSTFNTLIKEVVKRNLQGHDNTMNYIETNDKAFLLSYPEVFSRTYEYYRNGATLNDFEGTQYAYYSQNDSNAGRIKYANNNGSASSAAKNYWLRSPSSYASNHWCGVRNIGFEVSSHCNTTFGLAPALAI